MNKRRPTGVYLATLLLGTATAWSFAAAAQDRSDLLSSAPPVSWPKNPRPAADAPNVLVIMTDDVGFGASSAFGGLIPTPTFESVASRGLKYNRFQTAGMCSPTRAALLTGRNPHRLGMGSISNRPTGYDGYSSVMPKSAATVARLLQMNGYTTAAFGKWHLTPEWELGQTGPFDRWPTSQGFNYFYGFMGGDTNQWAPWLIENTRNVRPPANSGYHFDRDMADHAIGWIREQNAEDPAKPFFVYYATGTSHSPHHAPKEWIARFKGKFDQGWDKAREEIFARQKAMGVIPPNTQLTPRPASLSAWDSLPADQKKVYARLMESYAGALAYADYQIGRVIDAVRESGKLDNTLIIFIQGDNGASAEGGLNGYLYETAYGNGQSMDLAYAATHLDEIGGPYTWNNYPAGWALAMDTPFQYYKQVASHFGGTQTGLVISWPSHIKPDGKVRSQFHYISDIAPTILDAAKITRPATVDGVSQDSFDGISMAYSFDHPAAPSQRKTQVFEVMQNFGIYHDGWIAAATPTSNPWVPLATQERVDPEGRNWELYDIRTDYSEAHDLAQSQPEKLAELQALFRSEAKRNRIVPIHPLTQGREGQPTLHGQRKTFTYYPGMTDIPETAAPPTINRSFSIAADVSVPEGGGKGVMVSQGGRFGGYALYLDKGRPVFHYNTIGTRQFSVRAAEPLTSGDHRIVADFRYDGGVRGAGGTVIITVDGRRAAEGRIGETLAFMYPFSEGFDVGRDNLTPVSEDYTSADSDFVGTLRRLVVSIE